MKRMARAGLVVTLACALVPAVARGAGSTPVPTTPRVPDAPRKTPAEQAVDHYNAGLRMLERAAALETKARGAAEEKKRARYESKARSQYERAIEELTLATVKDTRFHQAFSSLGYARRRTGDHTAALAAYDRALSLAPDYPEAIEYRAEALLGLGRTDEARRAYITLFASDRPRADQLLAAMEAWVEARGADPRGLPSESVAEFRRWVDERREIARNTPATRRSDGGTW